MFCKGYIHSVKILCFFLIFAACREAYSQADEQYACNLGCQSQLPFAKQRQEQVSSQVNCILIKECENMPLGMSMTF